MKGMREGERKGEGEVIQDWQGGRRGRRERREGIASGRERHFAIFMRGGWLGKRAGRRKGREMYTKERRDVQRKAE